MLVQADAGIWADGATDPLDVLELFAACAERRHTLIAPGARELINGWMDVHLHPNTTARQRIEQVIGDGARRFPTLPGTVATITVVPDSTDWNSARVSPKHAVKLLQRPLRVLVENRRNDAAFLRRMARPSDRRSLQAAEQQGWVEFEMAGGIGELRKRLEALAEARPGDHELMIQRARTCAIFDKDGHPADRSRESDASRAIRELASQISTPWPLVAHQLQRRSIENYVPVPTMRSWWCGQASSHTVRVARTARVNAFATPAASRGLSDAARHAFNMKKGLVGDVLTDKRRKEIWEGSPLVEADLDPIFQGLDPTVRDELAAGGFAGVGAAFGDPAAITDTDLTRHVGDRERTRLLGFLLDRM